MPRPGNTPTTNLVPFEKRTALTTSVKRVRDKLREEAEQIYQEYRNALKMAVAAGQYEAALKGYAWLVGHIPADEEGVRMVDADVDKEPQGGGNNGPIINIGLKLGALEQPKQIPPVVIDIDDDRNDE